MIAEAPGIARRDEETQVPESDHLEAVQLALELGNDIDATNSASNSALHGAAFAGLDSVVQFLADSGAKLSEKNRDGQTPLGIAEGYAGGFFFQRPSTAALLRRLGAVSEGAVTLESFQAGKGRRTAQPREPQPQQPGTPQNKTPHDPTPRKQR